MKTKISNIVPVYNAERYIGACIESALSQTEKSIELLLVDDGSTDASGEICEGYATTDTRVRVIRKENGGVSSARNAGLDASNGEYIAFLDADDLYESQICQRLLCAIEQDGCDMAVCGFSDLSDKIYAPSEDEYFCAERLSEAYISMHRRDTLNVLWNKLYRRDILGDQRFDGRMYMGEDYAFNLEYLKKIKGGIAHLSYVGYRYNDANTASAMHRYKETLLEQKKMIYAAGLDFADKKELSAEAAQRIHNTFFYDINACLQILYFSDADKNFKREQAKRILSDPDVRRGCRRGRASAIYDKVARALIIFGNAALVSAYYNLKKKLK